MKLNAQQLIERLAMNVSDISNYQIPENADAIRQAIEAVKALQQIAQNGKSNEADIIHGSGGWCA